VSSVARIWVHEKTGTELISMSNDDENKCMSVVFRTPPSDSRGAPHVLEHSVLCGSRKYPVKEPFVELIRTSLNTFLNAMTSSAWTAYPVASCNEQDFYNLVDVYMDAVFHPNLTPDTLAQEGHHFELEEGGSAKDVKISGVVRNEMVGAYNSGDRILGMASQRVLYPDTTYGVESGGHPRDIPDLTWDQFKGFHDQFYHPSNARIFFYGDDAEEKRLAKADEYVAGFDRRAVDSEIALQKKWDAPKQFEFTYDAGAGDLSKKFMATVNWAIIDPPVDKFDDEQLMALSIANHVLLAMSSSPLRKALTDSNLGEDVVGGGLDTDTRQMNFSIGLKGMEEGAVPKMQALVIRVLEDAAENGFPKEMVDASLNSIEFRLRENNTGSFPKGLSMLFRSVTNWILDADPFESLKFNDAIRKLRARLDRGEPVFQDVLRKYVLDNTHRALVTLRPDPDFAKTEIEVEQKRIADAVRGMSADDLRGIVENTKRLKALQSAPDDPKELAKIPRLGRADLDKKIKKVPHDRYDDQGAAVLHHPLATNGVVYVDMCFDMRRVPAELLPLTSVFVGALTELGTTRQDFVSLQQAIARTTGGINSSTYVSQVFTADGNGPAVSKLTLRGKGMVNQVPALLDLMREVIMDVNVNNKERMLQLLLEERASMESGIAGSGHQVAMGRLGAMFRKTGAADEEMGGINFLDAVRDLIVRVERDWDSVAGDLTKILAACVSRDGTMVNVTTSSDDFTSVKPALSAFLGNLPAKPVSPGAGWVDSIRLLKRANEGLIVPSGVNYVAKAVNLCDLGFATTGGHSLAAKALGTSYLWDR
jgi:presequence protease